MEKSDMSGWKTGDPDRRTGGQGAGGQGEIKGFTVRYELLGIISLMVVQLVGASWWASSMAADVRYMRQDIVKLTLQITQQNDERYKASEAAKDFAAVDARMNRYEARLLVIENKGKV